MKIDGNKIIRKIKEDRQKNKRGRITLYLNLKLYEDFQKRCGDEPASTVIEYLMSEFMNSKNTD